MKKGAAAGGIAGVIGVSCKLRNMSLGSFGDVGGLIMRKRRLYAARLVIGLELGLSRSRALSSSGVGGKGPLGGGGGEMKDSSVSIEGGDEVIG